MYHRAGGRGLTTAVTMSIESPAALRVVLVLLVCFLHIELLFLPNDMVLPSLPL